MGRTRRADPGRRGLGRLASGPCHDSAIGPLGYAKAAALGNASRARVTMGPSDPDPRCTDAGGRLVSDAWIADRMKTIEASGIRKAFDMAKSMRDPINLSIGLPDFDVADPVKAAAIEAIGRGRNAYTVTQGIPELRDKLQAAVAAAFSHADRQVLITSGTSGALLLALCS